LKVDYGGEPTAKERVEDLRIALARRFTSAVAPDASVVRALGRTESQILARTHYSSTPGADYIDEAMRKRGLLANHDRALGYTVFSRKLGRPKFVCVIPYASLDPKSNLVGGAGFAQDQGASGVVVEMNDTTVSSFTTLELNHGKPIEKKYTVSQLTSQRLESLAREPAYEKTRERDFVSEISLEDSATIAVHSFGLLVTDEHSGMIHTPGQMASLLGNAGIVKSIAQIQHMRLAGVHMDVNACCSTCSCCWGCCCSSATSSASYVGKGLAR